MPGTTNANIYDINMQTWTSRHQSPTRRGICRWTDPCQIRPGSSWTGSEHSKH